jgi:hypothetical protein
VQAQTGKKHASELERIRWAAPVGGGNASTCALGRGMGACRDVLEPKWPKPSSSLASASGASEAGRHRVATMTRVRRLDAAGQGQPGRRRASRTARPAAQAMQRVRRIAQTTARGLGMATSQAQQLSTDGHALTDKARLSTVAVRAHEA